MTWKIINGNNTEVLKQYPDNSFDAVVTDPPYGISFLGKDWDSKKATETTSKLTALHNLPSGMKHTSLADDLEFQKWMSEVFSECIRVLKPGGHLLAFSAARTYHHMAMAAQFAGFEIRDQLMWIYGSGFPKSQDVGRQIQKSLGVKETVSNPNHRTKDGDSLYESGHQKTEIKGDVVCTDPLAQQWEGWGTQLKPAHEPIVMARKPVKGSIRENVLEHGTGAINIDATRVGYSNEKDIATYLDNLKGPAERSKSSTGDSTKMFDGQTGFKAMKKEITSEDAKGRFPANVILDREAGKILDEQAPKVGNLFSGKRTKSSTTGSGHSLVKEKHEGEDNGVFDGLGGASRFFYCPKVSRKERHIGFEKMPEPLFGDVQGCYGPDGKRMAEGFDKRAKASLDHIKPFDREKTDNASTGVQVLRKRDPQEFSGNNHPTVKPIELMKYLIKLVTPPNGHILDPFNGSGSTGCAAVELGFDYTGIELDPNYVEIATKRISYWESECKPKTTYNELFEEE